MLSLVQFCKFFFSTHPTTIKLNEQLQEISQNKTIFDNIFEKKYFDCWILMM